jgi:ATP-dependent RNA helicase MRH4
LVKDLKPRSRTLGRLEVAPRPTHDKPSSAGARLSQSSKAPRPTFARDSLPHEGVAPAMEGSGRPLRRRTNKDLHPIPTSSPTLSLKHWAARAHAERTERRVAERRRPRPVVDPLGNEFNTSKLEAADELPNRFTSPPLTEGLLTCLNEILPPNSKPTPIQGLSLKYLFRPKKSDDAWRQYLLASETGSGKSIAYLLPVLQDLKQSENAPRPPAQKRPINPRALILAPTHELSRQLASFAKSLLHVSKLRVLCASRANSPSTPRRSGTAARMAMEFGDPKEGENSSEFEVRQSARPRPVDLLIGTPNKVLEMARGRGWNWEEMEMERMERKIEEQGRDADLKGRTQPFWTAPPEMGLSSIEWVVVDEADVLFGNFAPLCISQWQKLMYIQCSPQISTSKNRPGCYYLTSLWHVVIRFRSSRVQVWNPPSQKNPQQLNTHSIFF